MTAPVQLTTRAAIAIAASAEASAAAPAAAPAIEIRNLTREFGRVPALQGLNLVVPRGAVIALLGARGAGKTTVLSILAGLAHPTHGEARVCGLDVVRDALRLRRRVGFLRQNPRFHGWMTGREALQFSGRFFNLSEARVDRRADELIQLVGMIGSATRRVEDYSDDLRQRLGIAQALFGSPDVLLLDEPAASLDPARRRMVMEIVARLRSRITVMFSTSTVQDLEGVADHVAVLHRGRCLRQTPLHELTAGNGPGLT